MPFEKINMYFFFDSEFYFFLYLFGIFFIFCSFKFKKWATQFLLLCSFNFIGYFKFKEIWENTEPGCILFNFFDNKICLFRPFSVIEKINLFNKILIDDYQLFSKNLFTLDQKMSIVNYEKTKNLFKEDLILFFKEIIENEILLQKNVSFSELLKQIVWDCIFSIKENFSSIVTDSFAHDHSTIFFLSFGFITFYILSPTIFCYYANPTNWLITYISYINAKPIARPSIAELHQILNVLQAKHNVCYVRLYFVKADLIGQNHISVMVQCLNDMARITNELQNVAFLMT